MKHTVYGDPKKLQERKEKRNRIKAMSKKAFSAMSKNEQDEAISFILETIIKEDS